VEPAERPSRPGQRRAQSQRAASPNDWRPAAEPMRPAPQTPQRRPQQRAAVAAAGAAQAPPLPPGGSRCEASDEWPLGWLRVPGSSSGWVLFVHTWSDQLPGAKDIWEKGNGRELAFDVTRTTSWQIEEYTSDQEGLPAAFVLHHRGTSSVQRLWFCLVPPGAQRDSSANSARSRRGVRVDSQIQRDQQRDRTDHVPRRCDNT
ncbi:unnamed protein product, partial [Prorocentrum cordatum]